MSRSRLIIIFAGIALGGLGAALPAGSAGDQSQAAWALFARINQPAPDGLASTWENWALPTDLFPSSPNVPAWPAQSATRPKRLEPLQQQLLASRMFSRGQMHVLREPVDPSASSEVHLNCPAFAFVVTQGLWNQNGQFAQAGSIQSGSESAISFPPEAVAVKAKWRMYNSATDDLTHFHVASDAQGQKWVLVGLHVTSKELPNWLWATWEQIDNNPSRPPSADTFGFPNNSSAPSSGLAQLFRQYSLGGEWLYYRLNGTQTDYLSPQLLGNSQIEGALLPTASCMTCHARAARSKDDDKLSVLDSDGNGFKGVPSPGWFTASSGDTLVPMDFLWTLIDRPSYYGRPPAVPVPVPDCSKIN